MFNYMGSYVAQSFLQIRVHEIGLCEAWMYFSTSLH